VSDKEVAKTIKADVKAKLNTAAREYNSYQINSASLNETLRQITDTKKSETPIGLASVVTSNGGVTQGQSQNAFVDPVDGMLTTPETLPAFTAPVTDAERNGFTIIHSHPLDAFTANPDGTFTKATYGDNISGTIYNAGPVNKVNPSTTDRRNATANGNNYNLILVGNVVPIQVTDKYPTAANSPKVLTEGTAGATFYKNGFNMPGFDMTEKALKKVQKEVEKQSKPPANN
jgi:hypothetical protein